MSRTTDQASTPASAFIQYFEHSHYKDFILWKEFAVKALEIYDKEVAGLKSRIMDFDSASDHEREVDENGVPIAMDGWQVHEGEALSVDFQQGQILPLMIVGAFNFFEKNFKDLIAEVFEQIIGKYDAQKLKEAKKTICGKNYRYIHHVDTLLSDAGIITLSDSSLKEKWIAIDNYKELRNIFAHNDNPIDSEKYQDRTGKVIQIAGVTVNKGYVTLNNVAVIINSCTLYEEFIEALIEEISKKLPG